MTAPGESRAGPPASRGTAASAGRLAIRFCAAWAVNAWVALSQLANAALLFGDPNESVSGRAGRLASTSRTWRVVAWVIDRLLWWDPDHCARSVERDRRAVERYIGARTAWRLARGLERR